ncbi:MAG: hypothetical protein J6S85_21865 [Methanobrevibacter sp.]|nr:hypothetical protein [Methanobrevibacter sp.]
MSKATLYKGNTAIKILFDVIKVKPNKKYGYFEITQKIYRHELITIARYKDVDKIIFVDKDGNKSEVNRDE